MTGGAKIQRVCAGCGITFLARTRSVRAGHGHFHDRTCWLESFGTLEERMAKYTPPLTDGCREWTGLRNQHGYGILHMRGVSERNLFAHRVAWEQANGPIPDGLFVLHRCDNPPCLRLDHLFLGTKAENTEDMIDKGRAKFAGRAIGPNRKAIRQPNV